jgi:hypothetical protein
MDGYVTGEGNFSEHINLQTRNITPETPPGNGYVTTTRGADGDLVTYTVDVELPINFDEEVYDGGFVTADIAGTGTFKTTGQFTLSWIPGDANHDGAVDAADAAAMAGSWGQSGKGWEDGDFNHDGTVGPADASILAANWGGTAESHAAAVPEPGALVLLAAGLLAMALRRRRR